ncbi:MAG: hypothetical protein ACQETH_00720 [Candidatus Rifleibacteriota bacterium]
MKKIVLHVGLPKTATTSLQSNLLMPLHSNGKINFLGRHGAFLQEGLYNPIGQILSSLKNGRNISLIRNELEEQLTRDLMNVISEECISISHNLYHKQMIPKLAELLKPYNTKILISLREPTSFVYAYYVEMFRWIFHNEKDMNSLNKFVAGVLRNPEKEAFDILFYRRLINYISKYFSDLEVILYEDLQNDSNSYFGKLGELLKLDWQMLQSQFNSEPCNKSVYCSYGKVSPGITLSQKIHYRVEKIRKTHLGYLLKNFHFLKPIYSKILAKCQNVKVTKDNAHSYLNDSQKHDLSEILCADNLFLQDYGFSKKKLKQFGYVR